MCKHSEPTNNNISSLSFFLVANPNEASIFFSRDFVLYTNSLIEATGVSEQIGVSWETHANSCQLTSDICNL